MTTRSPSLQRLSEVAVITDSLHKTPNYVNEGHPMIRVTDIKGGRLNTSEALSVDDETYREFTRRYKPRKGDIVFSRVGSYGNTSYVGDDHFFCLGQNTAIISPKLDSRYVYYCLQSPFVKTQIEEMAVGSTQKTISIKSIESLIVPTFSEYEMLRIAGILGALDDKIELNRKMNETLEGMARALFKSWFVDFDPVRIKSRGGEPVAELGISPEFSSLFPDSMTVTESRDIPIGWHEGKLADVCQAIFSGGTPDTSRKEFWKGNIPWLSSGETRNALIIKTDRQISEVGVNSSSTRKANSGDIVVAGAGQGNTRGQTSLLCFSTYINQSVVALRPRSNVWSKWLYLNLSCRYQEMRGLSDSHSIRGSLTTKILGAMRTTIPDETVVVAFDRLADELFKLMEANLRENVVLAAARADLLPRLLSGELILYKS
jgi:type I restriction enzyme S subunit